MGIAPTMDITAGFLFLLIATLVLVALAVYLIATGTDAASFLRSLFTLGLK